MRVWLLLSMLVVPPALAEQWMVLQSSDPGFPQGRMVDGSRVLSIAPGETLTLVSRSGRELVLSGPFAERLDALPATSRTGDGDHDAVPVVGATRDLGGPEHAGSAADREE